MLPDSFYHPEDFLALRKILLEKGLLQKRLGYFIKNMLITGFLFSLATALIYFANTFLLVIFAAAFLAFAWGQVALLGHDAGHRQICTDSRKDSIISYICSFLLGISASRWIEKHNEHHAHPNRDDMDPDIDFPVLAFSEKQALEKKGIFRFIVRHQAHLFFPMLCFTAASLRMDSLSFFFRKKFSETWMDITLYVAHFVLYFGLTFLLLSPFHAVIFIGVHQALFGLYLGLIFAPNHKGMPVLEKEAKIDFLREQVLTSRNVRSNWFINYCYGGLNFQIEHHLFPNMPRGNLPKASKIIKKFCEEKGIAYYETGVIQSYREIVAYMHSIGMLLRA